MLTPLHRAAAIAAVAAVQTRMGEQPFNKQEYLNGSDEVAALLSEVATRREGRREGRERILKRDAVLLSNGSHRAEVRERFDGEFSNRIRDLSREIGSNGSNGEEKEEAVATVGREKERASLRASFSAFACKTTSLDIQAISS